MDPDYIFGSAEVHYAYPYFEEVNKQLNEIILNNELLDNETNKRIRSFKRKLAISLFNDDIVYNNQQEQLLNVGNLLESYNFKSVLNSKLIDYWEKSIKNLRISSKSSNLNNQFLKDFMLARFDVKSIGENDNNVELLDISDLEYHISYPNWLNDERGSGFLLQSNKGFLKFKVKCVGDGNLIFKLRGPDIRDKDNNKFIIFIDYTSFRINDKEYLNENKFTNINSPHKISIPVLDGDVLNIDVKWLPLNPSRISNKYKK